MDLVDQTILLVQPEGCQGEHGFFFVPEGDVGWEEGHGLLGLLPVDQTLPQGIVF